MKTAIKQNKPDYYPKQSALADLSWQCPYALQLHPSSGG